MDDEGVIPGVDEAEGHCEARNHCTYGEAYNLSERSNSLGTATTARIFDLVGSASGIRVHHRINAQEFGGLYVDSGG